MFALFLCCSGEMNRDEDEWMKDAPLSEEHHGQLRQQQSREQKVKEGAGEEGTDPQVLSRISFPSFHHLLPSWGASIAVNAIALQNGLRKPNKTLERDF